MKKSLLAISLSLFSLFSAQAAETDAVEAMKKIVFAQAQGASEFMQQSVAEQLLQKKWIVKAGQLATEKCGAVEHQTTVVDLNKDGKPEVILMLGNVCTSGKIGPTIYLFNEMPDHSVQRQLGFSATGYKAYEKEGQEWPDLLFTGTGDCQPVWRNTTGRYAFNRLYEATPEACSVPASAHGHPRD